MKKRLAGFGVVIVVLDVITIVRANNVFEDVQLAPLEDYLMAIRFYHAVIRQATE